MAAAPQQPQWRQPQSADLDPPTRVVIQLQLKKGENRYAQAEVNRISQAEGSDRVKPKKYAEPVGG